MGGGVGWGSVPPPEICNRAECAGGNMTIEERLAEAQKLIDGVKAELAAKAKPARNWPEKIEPGMVFFSKLATAKYLLCGNKLVNLETGGMWCTSADPFGGDEKEFDYIGKIDLTIRTEKAEAHEPTGEELGEPIPDGAEWVSKQNAFYKGRYPTMSVWSSYENEPKHWCKSVGAHEKWMTPIAEWLAR